MGRDALTELTDKCCFCGLSITVTVHPSRGLETPPGTCLLADWVAHEDYLELAFDDHPVIGGYYGA